MKRLLHVFLCAALLASSLTSCKKDTSENQSDLTADLPETSESADILAEQDLQIVVKEIASGLKYDDYNIGGFGDGLTVVTKAGKQGFINTTGMLVIPCIYDSVWSFHEGLASVKKDGKWSFIDTKGNTVIELDGYDGATFFSDGMAVVKKGGKSGAIDKTGKLIVPCIYGNVGNFQDGLAVVWSRQQISGGYDYQMGYIDKSSNEIIPLEYDWISGLEEGNTNFPEGLLQVLSKDGKSGYIDRTGAVILPFIYDSASHFNDGIASVVIDGESYFIDKTGEILFLNEYNLMSDAFSEGLTYAYGEKVWL